VRAHRLRVTDVHLHAAVPAVFHITRKIVANDLWQIVGTCRAEVV
jgi:hypothetical protein